MQKPLAGIKVIEFTHAVMGPSAGMILGDLGAEICYIEPPGGSPTRDLKGFGSGYFSYFGRSKKSLSVDLKHPDGLKLAQRLIGSADVVLENFAPGAMDKLGLGYEQVKPLNPRLIYATMKGFLKGPYEQRVALDEVVQMMGGLAYMTGPSGQPLRAGTSVIDITGGMFAVIGVLSALHARSLDGQGRLVKSSLFETTAFLMGQHLAWSQIAKVPIPPMPERVSAWAIYQVFQTADEPVFVGVISDKHWAEFCRAFARPDLLARVEFSSNNERIKSRELLLPELKQMFEKMPRAEVVRLCEAAGIPFAPIARPEDLFTDPQLRQGGLQSLRLSTGEHGLLPRLPLEWDGARFDAESDPPEVGEHTQAVLRDWLHLSDDSIADLAVRRVVFPRTDNPA